MQVTMMMISEVNFIASLISLSIKLCAEIEFNWSNISGKTGKTYNVTEDRGLTADSSKDWNME